MKPLFSIPFFSILFSLTILADKESLTSFLPEDTFMVVEVDNWGKLREDLESGPWGKIQDFPIWQKVSDKIESEMGRKAKIFEAKKSVLEPLLDSLDGGMVMGISNFITILEREPIKLEDGTTKNIQKMPFFAFISESSLKQNDFEEIISNLEDLAKNVEVEKTKVGDIPVYWILQKSHKDLKDFDAKDAGLCLALGNGKLFMFTGGRRV